MAAQSLLDVVVVTLQTDTSLGICRHGWASSAGCVVVELKTRRSLEVCRHGGARSARWCGRGEHKNIVVAVLRLTQ
eukprot:103509-Heterocapsa_arctica.AAC.1